MLFVVQSIFSRSVGKQHLVEVCVRRDTRVAAKRIGTGNDPKDLKPSASGLALIESVFFGAGAKPAVDIFHRQLGDDYQCSAYALADTGQSCHGVNIRPEDEVTYADFSPPPAWNPPYSLQRIRLGAKEKCHFSFHGGEEIFIPSCGDVFYNFFFSAGGSPPHRTVLKISPKEVGAVRINPQIPHHAWGVEGGSEGWLVLRHSTDSPSALVIDHNSLPTLIEKPGGRRQRDQRVSVFRPARRLITEDELRRPGTYVMIAWGISEAIRSARQKSSLSVSELAHMIGVDASSLSRLEDAKANVSIELLNKVCRALRIGIGDVVHSGSWTHDQCSVETKRSHHSTPALLISRSYHTMHLYFMRISPGPVRSTPTGHDAASSQMSSWILLEGRVLVELPGTMSKRSLLLDPGAALHFRGHETIQIKALRDARFAQIVHSHECHCVERTQSASVGSGSRN
jgi:transcriptional regulator with XRE-family HTH domain